MAKFIKSIETQYKGCCFRSRLEARWAVFFDVLNISWEYEKEGFEFAGVRYLPDFWLSTVNMWAEVKPNYRFDKASRILATQLANQTGFEVLMLGGVPENMPYKAIGINGDDVEYCLTNYHDYPQQEHRFYCFPNDEERQWEDTAKASDLAKSARFEFGERGLNIGRTHCPP